jgi:hypothetical protein
MLLRLGLFIFLALLVGGQTALASSPPRRAVLVTASRIDGNTLGGNSAGFAASIKADVAFDGDPTSGQPRTLLWKRNGVFWAGLELSSADNRTFELDYFGPLKTVKGDTNGTTLARFMRHWADARVISTQPGFNVAVPGGSVVFAFNRTGRLVGARLVGGRPIFAADARPTSCFYPDCRYDYSRYDRPPFLP